jgi:pilus assembly protein CpaB
LKRSNRLFIVVGILLAAVAFVAVLLLASRPAPDDAAPLTVAVVVATAEIPVGTQLTPDMLTTEERPEAQAVDSYGSPDEVVGEIVRRDVAAGQVLRTTDFEVGEFAITAADVPAGQRAIAVALDKVGSVGFLVQAGDSVDIVLAVRDGDGLNPVVGPDPPRFPVLENEEGVYGDWKADPNLNTTTVKVLVENVPVLTILRPAPMDPDTPAIQDEPAWMAVLAVSPEDAELVRFAQLDGNLSLLLRSPEDRQSDPAGTTGVTLRRLVDEFGVLPPGPVTSQPIRPQEPLLP